MMRAAITAGNAAMITDKLYKNGWCRISTPPIFFDEMKRSTERGTEIDE